MLIHDWTRVDAGIFHHFHHAWIGDLSRALNRGLLPPDHYALAEQIAGGAAPGLLALQPRLRVEPDLYAEKANSIAIRHISDHEKIAIIEVISPGNKSTSHGLRAFVNKAVSVMRMGVHLVILDLFPLGPRDPQGIHKVIWDEFMENDFALPTGKPLTLASYIGGPSPQAFVEPTVVGADLPEMPLFLAPEIYVPLPLEATYQSAWEAVPAYWRNVMTSPVSS
jgi:Protein of unknown function (DUF4058)